MHTHTMSHYTTSRSVCGCGLDCDMMIGLKEWEGIEGGVCGQHDSVPKAMEYIINSYKRGRTSTMKKLLKPLSGPACWHLGRRIPRQ